MNYEGIAAVAAVATIIVSLMALGGVLITLGRVLERQRVHSEHNQKTDDRLDALEDGHSQHDAAFEALRGELNGLNGNITRLTTSLDRWTDKLEKHLEKE